MAFLFIYAIIIIQGVETKGQQMAHRAQFPLQRIEAELAADERVLWFGKPKAAYHAFFADVQTSVLLGTTAIAMLLLIILTAFVGGDTWSVALLALVVMGLAVSLQVSLSYLNAQNTSYIVTTHRIFILQGDVLQIINAIDFIDVQEHAGYGSVIFKRKTTTRLVPVGYTMAEHHYLDEIGFYSIAAYEDVTTLLADVFDVPRSKISIGTEQNKHRHGASARAYFTGDLKRARAPCVGAPTYFSRLNFAFVCVQPML